MKKERLVRKEMINFEQEVEFNPDFNLEKFSIEVLNKGLEYLKFPYENEINLLLTDSKNIQAINNEFRNIDKATDVLSFPMNDVIDYLDEEFEWEINPDTQNVILGDIVINVDYVINQALEYGHSQKREYAFLLIHSLLHLLGYDHITKDDEEKMIFFQKEILNECNIKR